MTKLEELKKKTLAAADAAWAAFDLLNTIVEKHYE